ncbi:MAG: MBL fold metallo-hydrolase [Thermoleophilia bacterium]|nr:MBL fold metallo-hydrolase [Thermoleophilia bacterium]
MDVTRIADGLWRWTAYAEEWGDEVGCVYYEAPAAIVLIDPLVPSDPSEATRFWEALDRDVGRTRLPVHVYITVFWHARSAGEVVRRYDGRLHATSRARAANERRTGITVEAFRPGDQLPGGIEALPTGRSTEVTYWIPEHGAVVPGDVILGTGDGGLRLCPPSWLPAGTGHARLRTALKPLLVLPVERVLVSHGIPVTEDAQARLADALADGEPARVRHGRIPPDNPCCGA